MSTTPQLKFARQKSNLLEPNKNEGASFNPFIKYLVRASFRESLLNTPSEVILLPPLPPTALDYSWHLQCIFCFIHVFSPTRL